MKLSAISTKEEIELGYAYVNGGPVFRLDNLKDPNVNILAYYENGEAAIVDCKVGKGRAILTGPHLEVTSDYLEELIKEGPTSTDIPTLKSMLPLIRETDGKRLDLLIDILASMGLETNKQVADDDSSVYPIWITSLDSSDTLYIKDRFLNSATTTSTDGKVATIKDFTGIFVIYAQECDFEVFDKDSVGIKFCGPEKTFPEFSISKFFSFLKEGSRPVFGANILYAQRIGSTQTTLEKCALFCC